MQDDAYARKLQGIGPGNPVRSRPERSNRTPGEVRVSTRRAARITSSTVRHRIDRALEEALEEAIDEHRSAIRPDQNQNGYWDKELSCLPVKEKPAKGGDHHVCQIGDGSRQQESTSPLDAAEYRKKNVF